MLKQKIEFLNQAMLTDYISVNKQKNPFAIQKNTLNTQSLIGVLGQYSVFPRNIISCFVEAIYSFSYAGWDEIAEELTHNLNEELGKTEEGNISVNAENSYLFKPHYAILRDGFYKGLGIDLKKVKPNEATEQFIAQLKELMADDNPAQIAGSVYALESSAITELQIVFELSHQLFEKEGKIMPQNLLNFFYFHVNEIEIEHRDHLESVCTKYVTETNFNDFEIGFRKVITIMDDWWTNLANQWIPNK